MLAPAPKPSRWYKLQMLPIRLAEQQTVPEKLHQIKPINKIKYRTERFEKVTYCRVSVLEACATLPTFQGANIGPTLTTL